jgi:hypothetical protein
MASAPAGAVLLGSVTTAPPGRACAGGGSTNR